MSSYRDPDLLAEIERLQIENSELRARKTATPYHSRGEVVMIPPAESEFLPYESLCPGCRHYPGIRTWNHGGYFDVRCGTVLMASMQGCGCHWIELSAAKTKAAKEEETEIAKEVSIAEAREARILRSSDDRKVENAALIMMVVGIGMACVGGVAWSDGFTYAFPTWALGVVLASIGCGALMERKRRK